MVNGKAYAQTSGSLNASSVIGAGSDNMVMAIAIQPDGKIVAGGWLTTYKGITCKRILRLNTDGSFDTSFSIGAGFDGAVYNIALQADGKIVMGGDFTTFYGVPEDGIAIQAD
ncbi:delta-60 repeat domain-containing protein [Chryseobacterium sp. Leaf201]|uniref:delta-60 repeat domain-containing protein n=1 Tax=Chryseobacterium sp. Leaf201 TaxID=1735672 RepID=UPI0006F7E91A|nr:delta-60 repeat domain-containing protein [Chryseobacterium sp. Leaf201]KQM23394.1 hypothetical protein ASE55_17905 [Chryseobacterium sp. Leaf201]